MIDLVKNNYYRKIGTGSTFSVEFDKMPSATLNHTEESKKAAIELYDLKQGELHLCYSGGVDSEFMLSIFMELGIPFTPVVFKITPNWLPLLSAASIVGDTFNDVNTSTPSPIVENFNLNGIFVPLIGFVLF